ncbi:MAG: response regulator [Chlorobiaceae bacterium]|jgi:DNA-binding response OmpR family regulator|nr:response regulator [Chlorobiaceae bacterium]
MRILLVDDEKAILDLMALSLKKRGHSVVTALNGLQGCALLADQVFDLMITDLIMPEMSGMSLIQHVTIHYPDMKVIAVTGGGKVHSEDYLLQALAAGAQAIIRKPFTISGFLDRVEKVLNE